LCSNYLSASGPKGKLDHEALREAARIIKLGGLVIAGTETFYCIAADASDESAVERIFRVKGRPEDKAVPLIAADRGMLIQIVGEPPTNLALLMESFWPGSLTVLLAPLRSFSHHVTGPSGKIGVRVPPPCAARYLSEYSNTLITATSANISGQAPPRSVGAIPAALSDGVDLVLDSGDTPGGMPSTVIECEGDELRVLRQGAIGEDEIRRALAHGR
jgi:L-threonylcarbamoyladenylate synthase